MISTISFLSAGVGSMLSTMGEEGLIEETVETVAETVLPSFWPEWTGFWEFMIRLLINVVTVAVVVHAFYYPKIKRRDYYFTFTLVGLSIFMLIYLMGGVKLKVGFALGLFAIFGIIKYRTEQVPIREMTYLFVIIAVAAINGLATRISYFELIVVNLIFLVALAVCENTFWVKHIPSKLITYDNIKLVAPDKEKELKEDLEQRLGLKIIRVEVGNVDFLKDSALVKIYYEPVMDEFGTIENITKGKRL